MSRILSVLFLLQVLVSCAGHQHDRVPSSDEVSEQRDPHRRNHRGGSRTER